MSPKIYTILIIILCILALFLSNKNSKLVSANENLNTTLQKVIALKSKVVEKVVTEKVYVEAKPELNSSKLSPDSPCLVLEGMESFIDQFGNVVEVDWNYIIWAQSNEAYKNGATGISTCYDAYFLWNGLEYHVNRNHRFMRL